MQLMVNLFITTVTIHGYGNLLVGLWENFRPLCLLELIS